MGRRPTFRSGQGHTLLLRLRRQRPAHPRPRVGQPSMIGCRRARDDHLTCQGVRQLEVAARPGRDAPPLGPDPAHELGGPHLNTVSGVWRRRYYQM
jgi:hypothetical protein